MLGLIARATLLRGNTKGSEISDVFCCLLAGYYVLKGVTSYAEQYYS